MSSATIGGLARNFLRLTVLAQRNQSSVAPTVFALSSGSGKCGVAIVRVSGPQALYALTALGGSKCPVRPREALLRTLKDPISQEVLDKAIILWFPGPNSFTGDDTCEFHVHGGTAVVSGVLASLSRLPGLKPAEPGEFSKRAFLNGRIDLTEAEGLADLIHAETEMQRRQALLQMGGSLHGLYDEWRVTLIQSLAHVEAYIDFSEDDNIEDDVMIQVESSLMKLSSSIRKHLTDGRRGERLRDGVRTVIVGEPNVGKSSLLNALCQKPAAIVTPIAGTTRDIVEQHINIGGYPMSIADTAGLREATDEVEEEGIARARSSVHLADQALLVIDSHKFLKWAGGKKEDIVKLFSEYVSLYVSNIGLTEILGSSILEEHRYRENVASKMQCIVVLNKADLITQSLERLERHFRNVVIISCLNEEGFHNLLNHLKVSLKDLCGSPNRENPMLSQIRHRHHLMDCLQCIKTYLQKTTENTKSTEQGTVHHTNLDLAICAEELRNALRHLGQITGHVTTEQVLDVIFKDFCIGK